MKSTYMIGEFSEMTGIPVRTLHYYDEADLLKPSRQASGHRIYTLDDLVKLQKILSLKSLGFSLAQVSELLKLPQYDQSLVEMLKLQQQSLQSKREKIDESLELISRIMTIMESEQQVDHPLLFSLIRNISQENVQREWIANHLSEYTAETLFDQPEETQKKLDAKTVSFTRDVKRLAEGPPDSQEAESIVGAYVKWVMTYLDQQAIDNFRNLNEEQVAKLDQLVEMPFNETETAWLDQALQHYFSKYSLSEIGEPQYDRGKRS
ncbi:MerR family transcriptional regulator [Bacillus sp. IITD106]|nr:MerR family transcriptional regulator [Bacillus sp. IITD106]